MKFICGETSTGKSTARLKEKQNQMKKTTDTKTEARCHCGDKAMYTVKIDYVWRGVVQTPSAKSVTFSRANQATIDLCEDCYPDTLLQIEAKVPAV
jgi:regulator of protease activity HflC (stomatin/prohibitin superfamily)